VAANADKVARPRELRLLLALVLGVVLVVGVGWGSAPRSLRRGSVDGSAAVPPRLLAAPDDSSLAATDRFIAAAAAAARSVEVVCLSGSVKWDQEPGGADAEAHGKNATRPSTRPGTAASSHHPNASPLPVLPLPLQSESPPPPCCVSVSGALRTMQFSSLWPGFTPSPRSSGCRSPCNMLERHPTVFVAQHTKTDAANAAACFVSVAAASASKFTAAASPAAWASAALVGGVVGGPASPSA
jgi:hypothetical protein